SLVRCHRPRRRTIQYPAGGPVRPPASPLDPSPAERVGRVARRERKRTACRVGGQEKVPTLASLRFGLPSPLLAHARGGGMGTTSAASRRTGWPAFAGHDRVVTHSTPLEAHLLIPPPRNAQAGWHVVSESERRVGWGCKKRPPPWPRFASAFPPHCSLTLAGEGWDRPPLPHHQMKRCEQLMSMGIAALHPSYA